MEKLEKFNKQWLGFVLGIIIPFLTLAIVYLLGFNDHSIKGFYVLISTLQIASKIFSLCVLSNLGLFFLFIWGNLNFGARGVLMSTFLIAAVILIYQFSR